MFRSKYNRIAETTSPQCLHSAAIEVAATEVATAAATEEATTTTTILTVSDRARPETIQPSLIMDIRQHRRRRRHETTREMRLERDKNFDRTGRRRDMKTLGISRTDRTGKASVRVVLSCCVHELLK